MSSVFGVKGPLTSPHNPLLRRVARLVQEPKFRHSEGLFVVWGWNIVEEALLPPVQVHHLLVGTHVGNQPGFRPVLRTAQKASISITLVEEKLLDQLCPGAGDQGLLALVRSRQSPMASMIRPGQEPLLVVADRIQEPGNLGVLMRVAEAADVSGLLTTPGTVDPYHPKATRASAGAVLRLPLDRVGPVSDCVRWCRETGIRIVTTRGQGGQLCYQADLRGPVLMVMGNEGEGVSGEWSSEADLEVTIPLGGKAESLNVTVAAAILLYEIRRQREWPNA